MAAPRRNDRLEVARVSDSDRQTAMDLVSLLGGREARDCFELRGKDGRVAMLSAPMLTLIERAARIVADGTEVEVLARDQELTSREAANLLGVSRQYLVRLLDRGEIPFSRTGNHRRVRSADLIDYRERRDAARRSALAAITQDAQASGGYDAPASLGPGRV